MPHPQRDPFAFRGLTADGEVILEQAVVRMKLRDAVVQLDAVRFRSVRDVHRQITHLARAMVLRFRISACRRKRFPPTRG